MNNKRQRRVFIMLMLTLILTCIPTASVYAYADDGQADEITAPASAEPAAAPATEAEQTTPPATLTPDGNLTLVDDISGEQSSGKQFITVITKGGEYFYLIIDRASDSENVYFLNLIDESDLAAIIEAEQTAEVEAPPEIVAPEPITEEPKPEPKPEQKSNIGVILGIIVLLALAGGGALFYVKVLKPKKNAGSGKVDISELDEFDFYDDNDGLTYEPEKDGEVGIYEEIKIEK